MNVLVTHGFEANYTLGFAKGLAANDVPLCVLSCDDTEGRLTAAGIKNVNIRGGQSEQRSRTEKINSLLRYYVRLVGFLFRNRGGTVHFTGIFRNELILFEGIVLHLLLKLLSGRYIYTAHNILPHNREGSLFFRAIYLLVYRLPDFVVVHTENTRQVLTESFGVPCRKIHVVSIGLNDEIPTNSISRKDARLKLRCSENDQVILFFGRIDEYKGLHLLLDAFADLDLPNTRLIIAGAIRSREYGARIESQIERGKRRNDVLLDSRLIPNEEVEVFLKAADVLCLPYLRVYQSGLLFLAMRFGIPVITTNVGSLAEFVTLDTGLITATNDAKGIRGALEQFFAEPAQFNRDRIRQIGEKYRWEMTCRDLVPLYEQRRRLDTC